MIRVVHLCIKLVLIWSGISLVTFSLIHLVPGDPVALALGDNATAEQIGDRRSQLGLDRPFHAQFAGFLAGAVQGDFGRSLRSGQPVILEVLQRFPATFRLSGIGLLLAVGMGIPAGIVAGVPVRGWFPRLARFGVAAVVSLPVYVTALLLVFFFGARLGWISVLGAGGLLNDLLAALCVSLVPAATIARFTQTSVAGEYRRPYVQTARAKGAGQRRVFLLHVLRNALLPVVTITGLLAAELITGTAFVEIVFSRAGLGRYAVEAVLARDYPQIQGVVLLTSAGYVLINQFVDLLYEWIDPRIRYAGARLGP